MSEYLSVRNHRAILQLTCQGLIGKKLIGANWRFYDTLLLEFTDPDRETNRTGLADESDGHWILWLWTMDWYARDESGTEIGRWTYDHELGFTNQIVNQCVGSISLGESDGVLTVGFLNGFTFSMGPYEQVESSDKGLCWQLFLPDERAILQVFNDGRLWNRVGFDDRVTTP